MKNILSRFKSWAVWLSLGAMVIYIVKTFGGVDITTEVNGFLDVLCPLLMAFGIINNPTDQSHF